VLNSLGFIANVLIALKTGRMFHQLIGIVIVVGVNYMWVIMLVCIVKGVEEKGTFCNQHSNAHIVAM